MPALFRDARLEAPASTTPPAASRSTRSARCGSWRWGAPARRRSACRANSPSPRQARLVGHAMMACPTLLAALQRLARSMDVVSNAATFALTPDADGHWFELGHLGGEQPVPRQRVEFGMLTMLGFCSWITGRELRPLRSNSCIRRRPTRPPPRGLRRPVRFGAAANRRCSPVRHGAPLPRRIAAWRRCTRAWSKRSSSGSTARRRATRCASSSRSGWRTPSRAARTSPRRCTSASAPCSAACRPKAPRSSNCSTRRGASSPRNTCDDRATRCDTSPICSASRTRATSSRLQALVRRVAGNLPGPLQRRRRANGAILMEDGAGARAPGRRRSASFTAW